MKKGVVVYHSADAGRSFQPVTAVPDWINMEVYVHNMLVLSDGMLFIPLAVAATLKRETQGRPTDPFVSFFSITSDDGGVTFSKPRRMTERLKTFNRGVWGISNVVCAAGRHAGKERVYAIWSEKCEGPARMRLVHSLDAGTSWSRAREVTPAVLPKAEHGACNIAVSRKGTIGVSWLNHESGDKYEPWFTASLDGGATFLPAVQISKESSRVLPEQERPFPGDDYLFMDVGADETFHVIWPDARSGAAYQLYTRTVNVSEE